MIDIKCNKEIILNKIQQAHKISNFSLLPVSKLVAVSKKQEDYKIDEAIKLGQKVFGENRVQEAQKRWEKRLEIYKDIELRLIGPLQTNKTRQALNLFDVIETIDREKLAKEISKNFNNSIVDFILSKYEISIPFWNIQLLIG